MATEAIEISVKNSSFNVGESIYISSVLKPENVTNKNASGGNMIYLQCEVDDIIYEVSYAHLYPNSAKVKTGDKVIAGQKIAGIGTTGYSTGPHLHFQVKKDGINIDGMSLIDFNTAPK